MSGRASRPLVSVGLVLVALLGAVLVGGSTTAADAKGRHPGAVGQITVLKATRTTLTLQWPAAARAHAYFVDRGKNLNMGHRRTVAKTSGTQLTIRGLKPGESYCFQVRAKNKHGLGDRSRKACQFTIGAQARRAPSEYRVLTYNTCGVACGHWSSRLSRAAALVRAQSPDVVMLQETTEDSGMSGAIGQMTKVAAHNGKVLLYRTSRFTVATKRHHQHTKKRKGVLDLGKDKRARKHRFAVWAELVDRQSGRHVIFVSVHLSPGGDAASYDRQRRKDTIHLLQGLKRINPKHRRLVVAGDFNSNQGRRFDSPGKLMRKAGLANSFFRAHTWVRPNYNSATQDRIVPTVGTPWGYHVDQVWTDPHHSVVHEWVNGNRLENGNYPAPQISNHSPVLVRVSIG